MSSLVRGLLPLLGSYRIVWNFESDLLSRRDISTKYLSYNIFKMLYLSNSHLILSKSRLVKVCLRLLVAPDELCMGYYTHRVISDKVHRLLVTLFYFRPD